MNESKSILRYLGAKYGYYPKDTYEAWLVDSTVDKVAEKLSDFYHDAMERKFDEAALKSYIERLNWFVDFVSKLLI